jgi:hypothetical protein
LEKLPTLSEVKNSVPLEVLVVATNFVHSEAIGKDPDGACWLIELTKNCQEVKPVVVPCE